jgi:hypothetical protein
LLFSGSVAASWFSAPQTIEIDPTVLQIQAGLEGQAAFSFR